HSRSVLGEEGLVRRHLDRVGDLRRPVEDVSTEDVWRRGYATALGQTQPQIPVLTAWKSLVEEQASLERGSADHHEGATSWEVCPMQRAQRVANRPAKHRTATASLIDDFLMARDRSEFR